MSGEDAESLRMRAGESSIVESPCVETFESPACARFFRTHASFVSFR